MGEPGGARQYKDNQSTQGGRREKVAVVSSSWFRTRESNGVSIDADLDDVTQFSNH